MNLLFHLMGLDNAAGAWYLFWSGFGANLGELTILLGLGSVYYKHTCHVDHCWRLGRHPVAGTTYTVCRRHHPDDRLTHRDLLRRAVDAQVPSER